MMRITFLVVISNALLASSHPCDSEHARECPSASGGKLGECMLGLGTDVSAACSEWLTFHKRCKSELDSQCSQRCEGNPCAFTEGAIPCVAFWTHPDFRSGYSAECAGILPEEVVEEESDTLKAERKKRKEERKRKRREKLEKEQSEILNLPDPTAEL
mmetsp:Transcript_64094/g.88066  ORF Transcript_64094/g.88066 Transcript_64094/m.88066 type:complete len:158 (-) Transcript_64094:29-502(-)|eukprot:CAMPEP_0185766608 /NCGR_PEP_ID=MMETSP1174-20130828/38528_1 /TAXON_ID=35687 /ORGANISM="Dictyocha speculum, Strain CCMP1381" /LENGTH=157 /DNA_ID=CAMNT_0028450373 /DNA_START=44 /DNA_END=517 /DNA_ORIENTATION=+